MKPRDLIGFIPFVLFSLLAPHLGAGWAATTGLAAAVVVVAATARGGIKVLPVVQAVILLVMAVLGFTGGQGTGAVLTQYGPSIAALLMGSYMIFSAPVAPFTAQLARSSVPQAFWHSPQFVEVNRKVSTAWGAAVVVLGLCHLAGTPIDTDGASLLLRLAVNWVVPVLAFVRAARYTKRTLATAHAAAQERTTS